MSNYLKIYDFIIRNRQNNTNVNYFDLATDHPGIKRHITHKVNETIDRDIVFAAFRMKLSEDLNTEVLKDDSKIIKKSVTNDGARFQVTEIESDATNNTMFGVLNGGKIARNTTLEIVNDEADNDYNLLNGDRIYDDFFFMLHISFRCNKARLFILSKKNSIKTDSIFKRYLVKNLFNVSTFYKPKTTDYISSTYRDQVLGRSLVNNILISKSTHIREEDGTEYEVEIKLKPVATNRFRRFTQETVARLKNTKVIVGNSEANDESDEIKFSVKDPNTNTSKMVAFGNIDNFIPNLIYNDDEVLNADGSLDVERIKALCLEHIVYEADVLA